VIATLGDRLPFAALAALGRSGRDDRLRPRHLRRSGDGAILYIWPVLWESYFFGRRGAIGIVVWGRHRPWLGSALDPTRARLLGRWQDVVVSVGVVATVVELLAMRNRRLMERLAREARVDNLTGLLNRRGFGERAEVELARARREHSSLGLVSFDLDHFKS